MGQMVGADPEQLDALGNHMSTSADRLDSIRGEITSLLAHSHWDGPDADDFRTTWHHRLSGVLHSAAHATRDASHTLHTNASQQRDTSSAEGGGGVFVGSAFVSEGSDESFIHFIHNADNVVKVVEGVSLGLGFLGVKHMHAVAGVAAWAGLALNSVELGYSLAKDPRSPETLKAGVDVAFSALTVLAIGCPPAEAALFVGHLAADYLFEHPDTAKAIGDGVVNTAKAVADTVVTTAHAEMQVAESVVNVGKTIVDGGVNVAKSIFHW